MIKQVSIWICVTFILYIQTMSMKIGEKTVKSTPNFVFIHGAQLIFYFKVIIFYDSYIPRKRAFKHFSNEN